MHSMALTKDADKIPSLPTKVKWRDPSVNNLHRRFLKVSIKSEDEATIFIVISKPNKPEYSINNYTDKEVLFYQDGIEEERRITRS